jgi:hypothetical protein
MALVRNPVPRLAGAQRYTFDFSTVEKPYESYAGINVRLR